MESGGAGIKGGDDVADSSHFTVTLIALSSKGKFFAIGVAPSEFNRTEALKPEKRDGARSVVEAIRGVLLCQAQNESGVLRNYFNLFSPWDEKLPLLDPGENVTNELEP